MDKLKLISDASLKADAPELNIGSTVRVHVKIREGNRERIQVFEGTVIAKRGSGISSTFTVRRVSYGVGIERVFPVHSPNGGQPDLGRPSDSPPAPRDRTFGSHRYAASPHHW